MHFGLTKISHQNDNNALRWSFVRFETMMIGWLRDSFSFSDTNLRVCCDYTITRCQSGYLTKGRAILAVPVLELFLLLFVVVSTACNYCRLLNLVLCC